MNKPDVKTAQLVKAVDIVLETSPVDLGELKARLVRLIGYLASPEGLTEANCRAVDLHFCLDQTWKDLELPADFEDLLADIGGSLHDTTSHPQVARSFESTPEQLLARAKRLKAGTQHPGDVP